MKKTLLILCLGVSIMGGTPAVFADETGYVTNVPDNLSAGELIKVQRANGFYNNGYYMDALKLYQEVYKNNKTNANVNFGIGRCHLKMGNKDGAVEYLEKAFNLDRNVNKNIQLLLGKAYHMNGDIDKAINAFEKYQKTMGSNKQDVEEIELLLAQARFAKSAMANPLKVEIINLGDSINSLQWDTWPSFSADGKVLFFTSRRSDTKGGKRADDGEYYQDIYMSNWNESTRSWGVSMPVSGSVNSKFHDGVPRISPDGSLFYIYRNLGKKGSGEIYVSKQSSSGKWSSPKPVGEYINTSYYESSPTITQDGNTMYFVSERPRGGYGNSDIWMAKKEGREWGEAVNLGPVINSIEDENSVYVTPDGNTLYFSSKGHNSMGGYDIFKSEFVNGAWTAPVNLGYPVNTVDHDVHFVVSPENNIAVFTSTRDNGKGGADLYWVDMKKLDKALSGGGASPSAEKVKKEKVIMSKLVGHVTEEGKNRSVTNGELTVVDMETNKTIAKVSLQDDGNFSITLPAKKKYTIRVNAEGYAEYSEEMELPAGEDESKMHTHLKNISLVEKAEE